LAANRRINQKRRSAGFNIKPTIIIIGVIGIILTVYIGYRASTSERNLFSVSLVALFAGLLFESFRISDNWKIVIYTFIGTYFVSLLSFLPGKREYVYNFENHIEAWPYYFIFLFSIFTAVTFKDKVTSKVTEGITLLLSISLIYWTIDYGFIYIDHFFVKSLLAIVLIFSVFSIIQALTYFKLSKNVRLTLSIWSSIIVLVFAIDNIISVYQNENIETTEHISQSIYIGLQYFFLGVSVLYITQNYILVAGFLPSRNGEYKKDLKETIKDHLARYSENQIFIGHSIICALYAVTIYSLNYKYQILPRYTMIWLVFMTFPFILRLIELTKKRTTTNNRFEYRNSNENKPNGNHPKIKQYKK